MQNAALEHWSYLATIASAVAALAYVVLTGALVWVARRQSKISDAQVRTAQRQNEILALQAEVSAYQAVSTSIEDLAAASLALNNLFGMVHRLQPAMRAGNFTGGDPHVSALADAFTQFVAIHFPVLRSRLGAGHEPLERLLRLEHLVATARETRQWPTGDIYVQDYADPSGTLSQALSLVLDEQARQSGLLASARALRAPATPDAA